jgi:hypothetical protein
MRSYAENVKRKYRKWIVEIQNFISIEWLIYCNRDSSRPKTHLAVI